MFEDASGDLSGDDNMGAAPVCNKLSTRHDCMLDSGKTTSTNDTHVRN